MNLTINTVHHMDCMKGMSYIPNETVDMILCDLPYGMLKTDHTTWDKRLDFEHLWKHYQRITKPNAAIVLTCVHPFTNALINSIPKGYKYRELIWYKSRGSGFLNAKKRHINQHENILVVYKETPIYNPQKYQLYKTFRVKAKAKIRSNSKKSKAFKIAGKAAKNYVYKDDGSRYPDTVLEFASVLPVKSASRKGMHPTEKPIDLFAYLIRCYTNQGALILDNCLGSGTTAVAAFLERRNFIAFEMESRYVEMANERIEHVLKTCQEIKASKNLLQ